MSFPHNFQFYTLITVFNTPEAKYTCSGWNNNVCWAVQWGTIFFRNNHRSFDYSQLNEKREGERLHLQPTCVPLHLPFAFHFGKTIAYTQS